MKKITQQPPTTQQRWLPLFLEFISHMRISSKELVGHEKTPLSDLLYYAQRYFLEQICEGLDRNIHNFVCLKARQLGISTIGLAIDVFWLSVHEKIQGAIVTDTDSNREKFRVLLEHYIASLPAGLRVGIKRHNKTLLELTNGSILDYLVAGTKRTNVALGQSRALNFLHATEMSSWGSDEGLASLRASLAQKHPHRLYIWESTAKGFNMFKDMYDQAEEDEISQKAFFIGWWMKEDYCFAVGSPEYRMYWDGKMSDEEIALCREVKKRFGFDIQPGQIAWHRWYATTQVTDPDLMNQNYPWTPEQAFILTGTSFFPLRRISDNIKFIAEERAPLKGYRYHLGQDFLATQIERVNRTDEAELRVWEEPTNDGVYAMGVDLAYGRSDTNDNHCIQVLRCYADKVIQVAEYTTSIPDTYQVTWVMAHIAGAYKQCTINCELQGPGKAIMDELRHLKQLLDFGYLKPQAHNLGMQEIFDCVRWYLYHRPDSMTGNYVYNFVTNFSTKPTMMNQLRDNYTLGMLRVRSIPLLREMESVRQEGSEICAIRGKRDDRVFAIGLANKAFVDRLRPRLIGAGMTYEAETTKERNRANAPNSTFTQSVIADFFKQREDKRERDAIHRAWQRAGVVF